MNLHHPKRQVRLRKAEDAQPLFLRGYCRVCNRHYFYQNKLDGRHRQLRQYHAGICQNSHYSCARINVTKGS